MRNSYLTYLSLYSYLYIYIISFLKEYMIPVRPSPPPPPSPMVPPHPPPCGVVWCGGGLLPPCFPPPSGVVWFGCGLRWFPPFPPPVAWCGLGGSPPHVGSACGVWQTHAHDNLMMMMMTIIMIVIITIILVFLWLVVGHLLPTCLLTIIADFFRPWGHDLCDSCRGIGCNGSTVTGIGPVRERGPRDCCLVGDPHVGVLFRKCLQSHETRSS